MKVKVSLNPNAVKQFFLDHVEKILFGLVVVVFLLFVYKAVARDTLAWQPQDLIQDADSAKKKIEATQPTATPIVKYKDKVGEIQKPIAEADYTFKSAWDPLIFAENSRRGLPVLFPIKDLRAHAGNGAFAMASPDEEEDETAASTGTMRGVRWAVVTGLIQHRKQKESYDAAFQEAAQWDYQRDYPDYVYYRVERAEVDPRVETAELKWTPIRLVDMMYIQDFFLQSGGEVVDPNYLAPARGSVAMAFPLGPLQNHSWGPEVAHLPEIPLAQEGGSMASGGMPGMPGMPGMSGMPGAGGRKASKVAKGGKADAGEGDSEDDLQKKVEADRKARAERRKKTREKNLAQRPDEPDSLDAGGGGASTAGPMMGMPGMPGMPGASGRGRPARGAMAGSMPGSMPGMTPGGSMPGMSGSMGPGMRGPGRNRVAAGDEEEEAEQQEVEYLLFRFFDFSVQPGKHYRYRTKLVLANPSFGMLPHFVEKEGLEKVKTLETDWSEVSPTVSVPVDSQVLAGTTKATNGTATLMLVRFEEKDGATAAEEFSNLQRGQLLNYPGREFATASSTSMGGMPGMPGMGGSMPGMPGMGGSMPGMPGMSGGMPAPGARGRAASAEGDAPPERKVDYITNSLLLDIVGGGALPGRDRSLVEPGSVLLLNGEGRLVVRNELDDLADYEFHKPTEAQPSALAGGEKKGSRKGAGASGSMSGSMSDMMQAYSGGAAKGKGKGKGKGGSSGAMPGMTPGMMPGMMPGSSSMGVGDLDDGSKRKKKSR